MSNILIGFLWKRWPKAFPVRMLFFLRPAPTCASFRFKHSSQVQCKFTFFAWKKISVGSFSSWQSHNGCHLFCFPLHSIVTSCLALLPQILPLIWNSTSQKQSLKRKRRKPTLIWNATSHRRIISWQNSLSYLILLLHNFLFVFKTTQSKGLKSFTSLLSILRFFRDKMGFPFEVIFS